MYESPITQILGEIQTTVEDDCMKVVQQCGFDVNKEELMKALSYDRNQYSKGYEDGYNKAIDDFAEKLHDLCGFEIDDIQYPYLLDESRIDEIAQQLKVGGKDGRNQ